MNRCTHCGQPVDYTFIATSAYPEATYVPPVYSPTETEKIRIRNQRDLDQRFFSDKKAAVKAAMKRSGASWEDTREAMRWVMLKWDEFAVLKYGPDFGLNCSPDKGLIMKEEYDAPTWYETQLQMAFMEG